jgi:O-acetyl-ADP-ribose deacetylase (regulator of RNase III)
VTDGTLTALSGRLVVAVGDITRQPADVIVNAASHFLLGTDGCSGAVLAAGGPDLVRECAALGGCEEGDAKLTGGYQLPCRHVLHAVAPVWRRGYDGEEGRLTGCYRRCFELAADQGCRTIAFPTLGTGGHGCPSEWAAGVAVREIAAGLAKYPAVERVTVVCYDRATFEGYRAALRDAVGEVLIADSAEAGAAADRPHDDGIAELNSSPE